MIKRLVWTIILLSPAVVAGFIAILTDDSGSASNLFNAGAAVEWTWESIKEFVNLFSEEKRRIGKFILNVIVASFFIAPLLFVWRGMFFIEWIPVVGHAFRAIAMAFLILLPGIIQIIAGGSALTNADWMVDATMYLQVIVLSLAMIGLWLPKSMTVKSKDKK